MVKMCFRIDKKGKETWLSIAFFPNNGDFFRLELSLHLDHGRVRANPCYVLWLDVESVS